MSISDNRGDDVMNDLIVSWQGSFQISFANLCLRFNGTIILNVRLERESFYKVKKEFFNLIYIIIFIVFFSENLFFRSKFPKKFTEC